MGSLTDKFSKGILGDFIFKQQPPFATVTGGVEENKNAKPIAYAIRYAADNGAKVINMSFGLPWFKSPVIVEEAIKYAISKDVLIVRASGVDITSTVLRSAYDENSGTSMAAPVVSGLAALSGNIIQN